MVKVQEQVTFSHTSVDLNNTLVLQMWTLIQGKNV